MSCEAEQAAADAALAEYQSKVAARQAAQTQFDNNPTPANQIILDNAIQAESDALAVSDAAGTILCECLGNEPGGNGVG